MRWEGDGKLKGEKSGRERRVEGREEWKGGDQRGGVQLLRSIRFEFLNIGDDKLPLL
jgi:hypothetical protein